MTQSRQTCLRLELDVPEDNVACDMIQEPLHGLIAAFEDRKSRFDMHATQIGDRSCLTLEVFGSWAATSDSYVHHHSIARKSRVSMTDNDETSRSWQQSLGERTVAGFVTVGKRT
jgi:hypothetical protein